MPEQKLTVEDALSELREMFPNKFIKVSQTETRQYDEHEDRVFTAAAEAWVFIGAPEEVYEVAPTLAEVMQKIRAWKEQNG